MRARTARPPLQSASLWCAVADPEGGSASSSMRSSSADRPSSSSMTIVSPWAEAVMDAKVASCSAAVVSHCFCAAAGLPLTVVQAATALSFQTGGSCLGSPLLLAGGALFTTKGAVVSHCFCVAAGLPLSVVRPCWLVVLVVLLCCSGSLRAWRIHEGILKCGCPFHNRRRDCFSLLLRCGGFAADCGSGSVGREPSIFRQGDHV